MRKRRKNPVVEFQKATLVSAINKIDDILEMKDLLPTLAVSYLYRVRRIMRWHLKNSTKAGNGSGAP